MDSTLKTRDTKLAPYVIMLFVAAVSLGITAILGFDRAMPWLFGAGAVLVLLPPYHPPLGKSMKMDIALRIILFFYFASSALLAWN